MKRTALVIGPLSMLGERLIDLLQVKDYRTYTCGRNPQSDVLLDLADEKPFELREKLRADVLFHCASSFFKDDTGDGPLLNEKTNALGCYRIARLAAAVGCQHVVYSGSISSVNESSNRSLLTSYGASKARGEEILQWALLRDNIVFTSLRYPQLIDERGKCIRHQAWFSRFVAYANAGQVLRMPGGDALRNYLHVLDAARLMIAAYENNATGVFAACHPTSVSNKSVAEMAFKVFGKGGGIEIAPEKEPFKELYIPASEKVFELLKCSPTISMSDSLSMIKNLGTGSSFGPLDVR